MAPSAPRPLAPRPLRGRGSVFRGVPLRSACGRPRCRSAPSPSAGAPFRPLGRACRALRGVRAPSACGRRLRCGGGRSGSPRRSLSTRCLQPRGGALLAPSACGQRGRVGARPTAAFYLRRAAPSGFFWVFFGVLSAVLALLFSLCSPLQPPRPCRPRWGLAGCAALFLSLLFPISLQKNGRLFSFAPQHLFALFYFPENVNPLFVLKFVRLFAACPPSLSALSRPSPTGRTAP